MSVRRMRVRMGYAGPQPMWTVFPAPMIGTVWHSKKVAVYIIIGYPHSGYYKSTPLFPGDLIKVVQQSETGSWYGECGHRKGRFKFNYVTLLPHYRN